MKSRYIFGRPPNISTHLLQFPRNPPIKRASKETTPWGYHVNNTTMVLRVPEKFEKNFDSFFTTFGYLTFAIPFPWREELKTFLVFLCFFAHTSYPSKTHISQCYKRRIKLIKICDFVWAAFSNLAFALLPNAFLGLFIQIC